MDDLQDVLGPAQTEDEIRATAAQRFRDMAQLMEEYGHGTISVENTIARMLQFAAQERAEIAKLQIQVSRLLAWHDLAVAAQARLTPPALPMARPIEDPPIENCGYCGASSDLTPGYWCECGVWYCNSHYDHASHNCDFRR